QRNTILDNSNNTGIGDSNDETSKELKKLHDNNKETPTERLQQQSTRMNDSNDEL
ncbi:3053_t:CDS:2, partial [Dentiscutata erythropus]